MAHDEGLAQRIRDVLAEESGVVEKKMFGGIGFMADGNMACGVSKDDLMLRINPGDQVKTLEAEYVRPFEMSGKPIKGWVRVGPEGLASDKDLQQWVRVGLEYARSLPAK